MRRAAGYTPTVGMVVRRREGENRAGQLFTITRVAMPGAEAPGIFNLRGSYEDSGEVAGDAERFELVGAGVDDDDDTAPTPVFRIGQEAIVSNRVVDAAATNHDCEELVPFVGVRVTITEIRDDGRIHFRWNGDHAWQCEPQYLDAVGAPVTGELQVGQRVEIVGPPELMHGLNERYYGETVITRIIPADCDRTASRTHIEFNWHGVSYIVDREAVRVIGVDMAAPAEDGIFAIGEEVEIVGTASDLNRVSAPPEHLGRRGMIQNEREINRNALGGYWQRVCFEGQLPDNAYWYPVGCIRRLKELASEPLSFDSLWRQSQRGQRLDSLMDLLWEWIAKPVGSLSRQRGDWGLLILSRAVLRLRRQMPNNYEEQLVKGHIWSSSRVWERVWVAAVTKP